MVASQRVRRDLAHNIRSLYLQRVCGVPRAAQGAVMPVLAFFFFFQILLMWTIFKVFIEFVTILYLSFCFVLFFVFWP